MEQFKSFLGIPSQLPEKRDTLKRKLDRLESREDDIKEELKQTESSFSTKKPRKEVSSWLKEVETIRNQVQQKDQEIQVRTSGYTVSELDKLTTRVEELIEWSKFPNGLTLESHENNGVELLTKTLIGKTFEKYKEEIWNCLVDGEDSIIGIYGMGGVGKTTLATHIHNRLRCTNLVLWITVSQDFKIHKLQDDIAKQVRLDLSKVVEEKMRAAELAKALKEKKNLVIILDDVWERICLDEVGICAGVEGCKLILTTRNLEVCRQMNCDKDFKVEPLSPGEAWSLFMERLSKQTLVPQIREIAKPLVKECGGLPLGIITMAASMRGVDDLCEWRNALKEIQELNGNEEFADVFRVLKYSYDKLRDPKVQQCLLYCSLFPEDMPIPRDELIEFFKDENLIDRMDSRQSEFDKGHTILNKLENACLLEGAIARSCENAYFWASAIDRSYENDDEIKCVKMHDLVRDMTIRTGRMQKARFLVKTGVGLRDIPKEEEWTEDLVRVSLMSNDISDMSFSASPPTCPQLQTLLLGGNHALTAIPNNFFARMTMLGVLDLSHTAIHNLPNSVSKLGNLTALLLNHCGNLNFVPSLAKLRSLRRLDLSDTGIEQVPEGMEMLINLRSLDLSRTRIKQLPEGMKMLINLRSLVLRWCFDLEMIPDGILPNLSQIQHLDFCYNTKVRLREEEIGYLRKLETFKGAFHEADDGFKSWEEGGPR